MDVAVPGAAPVFDLYVHPAVAGGLGTDGEGAAGLAAGRVGDRVGGELAGQQDGIIGGGAAVQEPGDELARLADLGGLPGNDRARMGVMAGSGGAA